MAQARVLILRAAGTNCDRETQYAWELAGATAERAHVRQLADNPARIAEFQILTIPGGFSYGDDIAAGRILAAQLERYLIDAIRSFIDAGGLVLGICNGFQVLVTAGLLPYRSAPPERQCAITANTPPGFQARWVTLRADAPHCVFTEPGRMYEMPVAHGEGRVRFRDESALSQVESDKLAAVRYAPSRDDAGASPGAPANPNGSAGDIAGLCDLTGRVFGLMPHPERFVTWTQHPCWTSQPRREEGDGLAMFRRAVAHVK